jgi:hypothetical protein
MPTGGRAARLTGNRSVDCNYGAAQHPGRLSKAAPSFSILATAVPGLHTSCLVSFSLQPIYFSDLIINHADGCD